MKGYIFLILLMGNCFAASSQDALFLNEAIKSIATELTQQLNNREIKQAGVADFTYQGRANTRIGKQMADELSLRLTMSGAKFVMTNREVVRKEIATSLEDEKIVISSDVLDTDGKTKRQKQQNIAKTGAGAVILIESLIDRKILKGTDAIIYGKIEDNGDYFKVIVEVIENSKRAAVIGAAIVNVIKTEDLKELAEGEVVPVIATQEPLLLRLF